MAELNSRQDKRRSRTARKMDICREIERQLMDVRFGGHRLTMSGNDYYVIHESTMNALIALAAKGRRR